jgi:hypothetical protein
VVCALDENLQHRLERSILGALAAPSVARPLNPCDIARGLASQLDVGWRDLMRPLRNTIASLADRGELEVTQFGRQVDVRQARGEVFLMRRRAHGKK